MSEANVDIVRGLFAAFESGDALGLVEPWNPNVVFHAREDEPDAGVHEGLEAVTALLISWIETFPNLSIEGETFRDAGDWVVASFVLRGSGGASGVEVAEPYSWAMHVRDDKLDEVREFRTEDEAVAAIRARSG